MMESKVVGVRRRSRVEADRLALEFERSGMSRQEFSRERGVSVHSLDSYRRRLRGARPAPLPQLLPVELTGPLLSSSSLRIELANGRRIVVEEGFSASLLQSVIAALEA